MLAVILWLKLSLQRLQLQVKFHLTKIIKYMQVKDGCHFDSIEQIIIHKCPFCFCCCCEAASSQIVTPSHVQTFFVFWKRPAERAIIPHINLQDREREPYMCYFCQYWYTATGKRKDLYTFYFHKVKVLMNAVPLSGLWHPTLWLSRISFEMKFGQFYPILKWRYHQSVTKPME